MKKIFIYLLVATMLSFVGLMLVSCDIQKESQKSKVDTNLKGSEEKQTFRKGDTVSYSAPKITYKDTTIYTTNRQGTTLQTVYDKQGNVSNIDCYASRIEELTKSNFELQQQSKDKENQKTEKIDTTWVLYLVIGLIFILGIAIFFIYKYVSAHTEFLKSLKI